MPGGRSLKGLVLVYDLEQNTLVLQVVPSGREETLQLGAGLEVRKIDAGFLHPVEAYMRLHAGVTEAEAESKLQAIAGARRSLST